MDKFRKLLNKSIKSHLDSSPVALLFSGGSDSLSIFWTLLSLDVDFTCYTFKLEQYHSPDFTASELACNHWGVENTQIIIQHKSPEDLRSEVKDLIKWMGSFRKTHVECTWPFIYIIPEVKERIVFTGLNADDLWGTSKNDNIKYGKNNNGFREAREKRFEDPNLSSWSFIRDMFAGAEKELFAPYRDEEVKEFLLGKTWQELNRPKQKMPLVNSFCPEFSEIPIYRKNNNLQVGSRIREYMSSMCPGGDVFAMRKFYKELSIE